jgi:hypothetical protein
MPRDARLGLSIADPRSSRRPKSPGTFQALENFVSIFSTILARIFPPSHPAVVATAATPRAAAAAAPPVDVEAVISKMPGASTLNWKTSIVDLLKVLGLDSGLEARKQLAHELGYGGNTQDSAAMNVWLHQEVVAKLAANGGKVPDAMKV